jgi:hypothetical protein
VVLLQETLREEEVIVHLLEKTQKGWSFFGSNAIGRLGGLAMGWNPKKINLVNSWGFPGGQGMKIFVEDLGRSFTVLNIYGPTHDHPKFWNDLLAKYFLKYPSLILGGDLNFSIGAAESWGQKSQIDSLSTFFAHKLEGAGLIDVNPIRLGPTWRNKRMGEDYIAKWLDCFLISSYFGGRTTPFQTMDEYKRGIRPFPNFS